MERILSHTKVPGGKKVNILKGEEELVLPRLYKRFRVEKMPPWEIPHGSENSDFIFWIYLSDIFARWAKLKTRL